VLTFLFSGLPHDPLNRKIGVAAGGETGATGCGPRFIGRSPAGVDYAPGPFGRKNKGPAASGLTACTRSLLFTAAQFDAAIGKAAARLKAAAPAGPLPGSR
jgi:hypothetical protein